MTGRIILGCALGLAIGATAGAIGAERQQNQGRGPYVFFPSFQTAGGEVYLKVWRFNTETAAVAACVAPVSGINSDDHPHPWQALDKC